MTRRATTGGETGKVRRSRTPTPKRRIASAGVHHNGAADADLKEQLDQRTRELHEALEQQASTAKVLQVINSSPGNLVPVFDAILEQAHALCGVAHGGLVLCEGETFRAVALHSYSGPFAEQMRQGYRGADNPLTRSLIDGERFVHIPDLAHIDHPMVQASVENAGIRTGLYLPLRKDGVLLGMISCCRREIRPFSDKEITLLESFAAQAVIAIENARLLSELRQRTDDLSEALGRQTATSEVLEIISSSPGKLEPVFNAVLENATRICDAKFGTMFRYDGDAFYRTAMHNAPTAFIEGRLRGPVRPPPGTGLARVAATKQVSHIHDISTEPTYVTSTDPFITSTKLLGCRTLLNVPMLKDDELVGSINLGRSEARPFTDKQIELVSNFAAQAVIAIENSRLLNELRESLQQQTATADVLKVISRSAFDLKTVLQTLLDSAAELCGAKHGMIHRYDGEICRAAAAYNAHPEYLELWQRAPIRAGRGTGAGRALLERRPVQIVDVHADPEFDFTAAKQSVRTVLAVPLLHEGEPLGVIGLWKTEVAPFTDRQI